MTSSPQTTDKIPIRQPDGSVVMVSVVAEDTPIKESSVPTIKKSAISNTQGTADKKETQTDKKPFAQPAQAQDKKPPQPISLQKDDQQQTSHTPASSPAPKPTTQQAASEASESDKELARKKIKSLGDLAPDHENHSHTVATVDATKKQTSGASAAELKEKIAALSQQDTTQSTTDDVLQNNKQTATAVKATDDQPMPLSDTAQKQPDIDWQAEVAAVFESLDLELFDETAEGRLRHIIVSRLRDVRDKLQTKEVLMKDRGAGGMGLSAEDAGVVVEKIETAHKKIHTTERPTQSQDLAYKKVKDPYMPEAELNALAEADLPLTQGSQYLQSISKMYDVGATDATPVKPHAIDMEQKHKHAAEDGDVLKTPIHLKPQKEAPTSAEEEQYEFVTPDEQLQHVVRPEQVHPPKPTMEDVVAKKRLMGPVEQLKSMRLIDFRRLGQSTDERLQKVKDVIHEMEDMSFTKKVEAIKAWRANPLYQRYVALGSQSLTDGKSVKDIITQREQAGQESLSIEEFEKLSDFNKHLRY